MMIKFEDKQDKTLHFIFAHSLQMYKDNEKKTISYKKLDQFLNFRCFFEYKYSV